MTALLSGTVAADQLLLLAATFAIVTTSVAVFSYSKGWHDRGRKGSLSQRERRIQSHDIRANPWN